MKVMLTILFGVFCFAMTLWVRGVTRTVFGSEHNKHMVWLTLILIAAMFSQLNLGAIFC